METCLVYYLLQVTRNMFFITNSPQGDGNTGREIAARFGISKAGFS
jgi:hypothetical protein